MRLKWLLLPCLLLVAACATRETAGGNDSGSLFAKGSNNARALFGGEKIQSTVIDGYSAPLYPNETVELRRLIVAAAAENDVPVELVQRQIVRESTHRPWARNGPYYGLMQILPATARSMGFRGHPSELLDAETNLKYAVRYLRGAWLVSGEDMDAAVMWYARGYYYEAKRLGLLAETGVDGRKTWPS